MAGEHVKYMEIAAPRSTIAGGLRRWLARLGAPADSGGLLRGSFSSVLLQITETGLTFLALLILARILSTQQFGNYIYAVTWVTTLALFGRLGFDTASVRYVATYSSQGQGKLLRDYFRFTTRVVLLLSALVAAILGIVVWGLQQRLSGELAVCLWMSSPLVILTALLHLRSRELQGFGKIVQSRLPHALVVPIALLGGSALVVWLCGDGQSVHAWELLGVLGLATSCGLVLAEILVRRSCKRIPLVSAESPDRRAWAKTGVLLVLLAGLTKLQSQIDVLMLGTLAGVSTAGVYAVASRIAGGLTLVLVATNVALAPMCARLHAAGNKKEFQRLVVRSARLALLLSVPAFVGIMLLGKPLLAMLGEDFGTAYVPLLILAVGQMAHNLSGPGGVVLNMTGNESVMVKILGVAVILNVALNGLLIPAYGMLGAAIATSSATIICRLLLIFVVRSKLGISVSPLQWPLKSTSVAQ